MPLSDYYNALPSERRERLQAIEKAVVDTFPEAVPSLRYKMPTFETSTGWIAFASQKNHISVYTCSEEKLRPYLAAHSKTDHGKGCLRFSDNAAIDIEILKEVISNALS